MVQTSKDRFVSEKNQKTMRFSSKHVCLFFLGVDAFAFNWTTEFKWYVPPVYLIGKTVKHFRPSLTDYKVILVCPYLT